MARNTRYSFFPLKSFDVFLMKKYWIGEKERKRKRKREKKGFNQSECG